eukprot:352201-Chlamydomonas_euryale.AAC.7
MEPRPPPHELGHTALWHFSLTPLLAVQERCGQGALRGACRGAMRGHAGYSHSFSQQTQETAQLRASYCTHSELPDVRIPHDGRRIQANREPA